MSTSVLKALPGKLDIKRHSPSILFLYSDCVDLKSYYDIKEDCLDGSDEVDCGKLVDE